MKEKLELVKFNLTPIMTKELIKFNKIKKELIKLEHQPSLNDQDLIEFNRLQNELNKSRIKFIKEFRENNKEEINKYLEIRDQF